MCAAIYFCWDWRLALFSYLLERDKSCLVDYFLTCAALHEVDEVKKLTFGPAVCEHKEVA